MKTLIVSLILFLFCNIIYAERLFLPFLTRESQSNVVVTAEPEHPKPCPPEYTNLISNTNLFTLAEQELLKEIPLKYKNVTTNIGPDGTVFKGIELRRQKLGRGEIQTFQVSCFSYTNFNAREEIACIRPRHIFVNFRTQSGDGYNINLIDGRFGPYQEIKHGVMDGICIGQGFDKEHCNGWSRYVNGKIVGKYLSWNQAGEIEMEAEFKEPFDFLKNGSLKFDLSWTEVPTNATESVQSIK